MKGRVLVTGGTGFVGSFVVEEFVRDGWEVRPLIRNPRRLTWMKGLPVTPVVGTLVEPESLSRAVRGCDVVVHCAGLTKAVHRQDFFRVNAEGVGALVRATRENGVRRFIYCSSQAAGGPSEEHKARVESDPPRPVSVYGQSKLQGEREVAENADGMEWVILRPPSVMGPRDFQFLSLFRSVARFGIYPVFGRQSRKYSIIDVRDLAAAHLLAAYRESGLNEVYYTAHPVPQDWKQVAELIAARAGKRVRPLRLGTAVLRVAGLTADAIAWIRGKPSVLGADKIREICAPGWICSPQKIQNEWGFSCRYSIEETVKDTYDFYLQRGLL